MASSRKNQENTSYQIVEQLKRQISRAGFRSWLGSWQGWGSVILLFLTLEIAVYSVEQARWITPQPSLTVVLALAVLTSWLLCKSRLPGMAIHPLLAFLGTMVTVWQASNLLSPLGIVSRVNQLILALQSWWQATSMAEPTEGTIHFAVFLIFFTWITGYISTWFLLRRQNAWVAILLGTITVLVNLSNLSEQHYTIFCFYILAALFLIGQTSLVGHHYWFKKHNITYPKRGIIYFMASLLCISTLAVSIAWLTPEIRVNRLETLISTEMPWKENVEEHFTNFFAAVPAKQPFLKSNEQREVLFGDSFDKGNQLQFAITSKQPRYWRVRTFDIYTSWGWTSSDTTAQVLMKGMPVTEAQKLSNRSEITYVVVPKLRTDIVLTAGEFVSSDTPVSMQRLIPLSFNIDLFDPSQVSSLPPDVTSLAHFLRSIQLTNTVTVTTPYLLRPEQRYTVTSNISLAKSDDLVKAGDDYPNWVTDYYLQLPIVLPERVRQLSEKVTKEVKTPYEKALAIKQYLSQIEYTSEIEPPPQGVDGVDHFLFTQKSGNCVHFASAMSVMLRSVGIPSRLCIGYFPDEWDTATGSSTLRAKHRHAWLEVYFPNYGWVEFEATPVIDSDIGTTPVADIEIDEDWGEGEILMEDEDEFLGGWGTGTTSRNRWGLTLPFAIIGIILLMFVLWLATSRWLRRFTRLDFASEVYGKMCFLASLTKLNPKLQQTPLE